MLKHSVYYSTRILTAVAVMQPIKQCGFVATQSPTKRFWELFDRRDHIKSVWDK